MEDIKGKPAKGEWGGKPSPATDRAHVKATTEFLGSDRNLVQRMASPMVRLSRWFSNRRLRKSSEYWQGFDDTIKAAQQQHPRAAAYVDAERRARIAALKEQWRFPRTPQQPAQAAKQTPPKSTVG